MQLSHTLSHSRVTSARPCTRAHATSCACSIFAAILGLTAPPYHLPIASCSTRSTRCIGQVLIRTLVAGINGGADTFTLTNAAADAHDIPLGKEGVGVVVAVGAQAAAAGFAPGQRVTFIGAGFREYTRVRARLCHAVDPAFEATEQVALRVSGHTAAVALGYTRPILAGDVVVVTACCGATGSFAVQIAKAAGAITIGTVGSEDKARSSAQHTHLSTPTSLLVG
jgi:NADPH:quinone reductase-like Zn-dependent oxidoreductase